MKKVLIIEKCCDCNNYFNDYENRGYDVCLEIDKVVEPGEIHKECPLPDRTEVL
jgi:hypothetical protein